MERARAAMDTSELWRLRKGRLTASCSSSDAESVPWREPLDVLSEAGSADVREPGFARDPELDEALEAASERSSDTLSACGMDIAGVGRHSGYSSSKRWIMPCNVLSRKRRRPSKPR